MLHECAEIQANVNRAKDNAAYIASVAEGSESGFVRESSLVADKAVSAARFGDLKVAGQCAAETARMLDYFTRKRLETFADQHWPVRVYRLHGR